MLDTFYGYILSECQITGLKPKTSLTFHRSDPYEIVIVFSFDTLKYTLIHFSFDTP